MDYLENFGFRIFRCREIKETDEYILYNTKTERYNQYSRKRLVEMIKDELRNKGINLIKWIEEQLQLDRKEIKEDKILNMWINTEAKLIDNLSYKPSKEILFTENDKIYFNVYKMPHILKADDYEKGDFPNIRLLMLNLVGYEELEYEYFIKWLAWQIQNPLDKLPTSIILQGEHGTGKSKFCELVLKRIFESNFIEIGQSDINKEYNEYILGKQLIVANEVIHNDNKFLVPDKLKNYVTDEYLSINRKFKDTIYTRNYSHWIFISNNIVPLKIEKGDRRYSVFKSKKLKNGFELIENLKENLDTELEHFMNHLVSLELNYNEIATPLDNEAKQDLIKNTLNSVEEFMDFAKDMGGLDKVHEHYKKSDDYYNILEFLTKNEMMFVVTDKLYKLYLRFCSDFGIKMTFTRSGFTRQLKHLGFESSVQKIDDSPHRVIVLAEGIKNE